MSQSQSRNPRHGESRHIEMKFCFACFVHLFVLNQVSSLYLDNTITGGLTRHMYKVNVTQGKMNWTVIVEQKRQRKKKKQNSVKGPKRHQWLKRFLLSRERGQGQPPNQSGEDEVKGTDHSSSLDVQLELGLHKQLPPLKQARPDAHSLTAHVL